MYKVKRLADGVDYALKKVKLGNLSDKEKQNALNEVRILASVTHKNIIGYKEAFIDEPSNCLLYCRSATVASLWSTLTMATYTRRSWSTKKRGPISQSKRSGASSCRLLEG